jgi:L,D-peptidoglycan transpeptidase YkuD (ErfK/YbiS/YcfS/YnhG family)
MKKIIISIIIFVVIVGVIAFLLRREKEIKKMEVNPTSASTQMVLVRAHDWNSIMGTLQLYERKTTKDAWIKVNDRMGVSLGKNGLGWGVGLHGGAIAQGPVVAEGSKRSPVGVFALRFAFGQNKDKLNIKLHYQQITDTTFCPDDPKSKYYNRIVDSKKVVRDWNSAEDMYRYMFDGFYTYGVIIEHNFDNPVPGSGSCFFLHVYKNFGVPTAGCTAVALNQMEKIITWLDPSKKPVLVQLPDEAFIKLKQQWNLPE